MPFIKSSKSVPPTDVVMDESESTSDIPILPQGELFWTKIGSHPYWPCMIYRTPPSENLNGAHWKKFNNNQKCKFHVQFFGPLAERSWVTIKNLLPYTGKKEWDKFVKTEIEKSGNKKQVIDHYSVSAKVKSIWDASWLEADECLSLSNEDRVEEFGRVYVDDMNSNTSESVVESKNSKKSVNKKPVERSRSKRCKISSNVSESDKSSELFSSSEEEEERVSKKNSKITAYAFEKLKFSLKPTSQISGHFSFCIECGVDGAVSNVFSNDDNGSDNLVSCSALCGAVFHPHCSALLADSSNTNCNGKCFNCSKEESSTNKTCFICQKSNLEFGKNSDANNPSKNDFKKPRKTIPNSININILEELVRSKGANYLMPCADKRCLRVYHPSCLLETSYDNFYRLEDDRILCPLHTCHSCVLENPGSVKLTYRYLRCIYCPAAYHPGDWCIPAGSVLISQYFLICPRHCLDVNSKIYPILSKKFLNLCLPEFVGKDRTVPNLTLSSSTYLSDIKLEFHNSKDQLDDSCSSSVSSSSQSCSSEDTTPGRQLFNKKRSSNPLNQSLNTSQNFTCPISGADLCSIYQPTNVQWCFSCSKGGQLICCENCPAAFHLKCLGMNQVPAGSFICDQCEHGLAPRYGSIIWAKLSDSKERWWPAQVLHESNLPNSLNRTNVRTYPGEFCAELFGIGQFIWLTKARCFAFEEGDLQENRRTRSKKLSDPLDVIERNYSVALSIAADAFQKRKIKMQDLLVVGQKPDQYKSIKTNYPVGNVRIYKPMHLSELQRCDCKMPFETIINRETQCCGPKSDCINRQLMVECHPEVCPCGKKCGNQRLQLRQYPKQEPFCTPGRGWGLRSKEAIKRGQLVNEYIGDLIDEAEADRRLRWSHENNVTNFYMMILDSHRIIDAGPRGNLSRFMNHSCSPNIYAEKWTVNMDSRVGLFAIRDIKKDEELTFNYNFMTKGQEKLNCKCGSSNCSGFIGVPPANNNVTSISNINGCGGSTISASSSSNDNNLSPLTKQNAIACEKSPAQNIPSVNNLSEAALLESRHEVECSSCGEINPDFGCCHSQCSRAYHLACLKKKFIPTYTWFCERHYCQRCGLGSKFGCFECESAFCEKHWLGNLYTSPSKKFFCKQHSDILSALSVNMVLIQSFTDLKHIFDSK